MELRIIDTRRSVSPCATASPRAIETRGETDAVLLEWVLGKDERAWEELMRRFRPLMFRCIVRVVRKYDSTLSSEDINEIFGDVCVSLLRDDMRKLRAYDPDRGARLGSWLGLLSINAACDFLRQKARRPSLVHLEPREGRDADPLAELPAPQSSALDTLIEKERWRMLSGLLSDFSVRDRRFVELYYGNGLSAEEVATVMGISVKTVYSKKNKLRTRLVALFRKRTAPRLHQHPLSIAA